MAEKKMLEAWASECEHAYSMVKSRGDPRHTGRIWKARAEFLRNALRRAEPTGEPSEEPGLIQEVSDASHDIGWSNAISLMAKNAVTKDALDESRAAARIMAQTEASLYTRPTSPTAEPTGELERLIIWLDEMEAACNEQEPTEFDQGVLYATKHIRLGVLRGGHPDGSIALCWCGHPRHKHWATPTGRGRCSECGCVDFSEMDPTEVKRVTAIMDAAKTRVSHLIERELKGEGLPDSVAAPTAEEKEDG